jgi:hypothetical protein
MEGYRISREISDAIVRGEGQAGVVLTHGTLDTTTANVKLDATDTIGEWKDIVYPAFLYGESGR